LYVFAYLGSAVSMSFSTPAPSFSREFWRRLYFIDGAFCTVLRALTHPLKKAGQATQRAKEDLLILAQNSILRGW